MENYSFEVDMYEYSYILQIRRRFKIRSTEPSPVGEFPYLDYQDYCRSLTKRLEAVNDSQELKNESL